jgi:hypothetical protein
MRFRIETSAVATDAPTITRSLARMPSASQIGDTSMPARERSRRLSEQSRRRATRARKSIKRWIGSLQRAKIPQVGAV